MDPCRSSLSYTRFIAVFVHYLFVVLEEKPYIFYRQKDKDKLKELIWIIAPVYHDNLRWGSWHVTLTTKYSQRLLNAISYNYYIWSNST